MLKFFKSPLVRISFGLTMLTVSILLISDLLGLIPDVRHADLRSRKVIAESLAVQLSTEVAARQMQLVKGTLKSVVDRNDSLLSGALRMKDGKILSAAGPHEKLWTLKPDEKSTPTQVRVPLYDAKGRWGSIELAFRPLGKTGEGLAGFKGSILAVILFMALSGFAGYLLFLKRSMRELNPDAVIPERVRKALDTLSEGLLIVDVKGFIVFANSSFAARTGLTPEQLVGKKSGDLEWVRDSDSDTADELPWFEVLRGVGIDNGVKLRLKTSKTSVYTFAVNVSPITGSGKKVKGVLITFDDITEIENKNEELRRTLGKLEKSQREISRQNQELQVLATRDPLTGSLNRRSFFQGFSTLFQEAREEGDQLSCIMVDIDHFKSVNDRFGHGVGDQVIKFLATLLTEHSRPNDLVGRFGGEEFCVVLPGMSSTQAAEVGDRMRQAVQKGEGGDFRSVLRVTASFGVACLDDGVDTHDEMLELADKALYVAKESGRNRVVKWTSDMADDATDQEQVIEEQDAEDAFQANGENQEPEVVIPGVGAPVEDESQYAGDNIVMLHPDSSEAREDDHPQVDAGDDTGSLCLSSDLLLRDRIDQAIKRAERYATKVAVMVIDVDALRRVADTLGITVNDKLSKTVLSRLKRVLRTTDTVAMSQDDDLLFSVSRLDRSEIVVLLTDLKQTEILTTILQRIFSLNNEPVEVEGNEFYLHSNVGVSLYPNDGADPDTLVAHAGSALREARDKSGRNNFRFYAEDINQRSKRLMRMDTDLHRAVERDEFIVHYQPKIDLGSGEIIGMEALLRWKHPQMGLVPPNDFIPLAEQSGLIEDIDFWVLRSVCEQINAWTRAGYGKVHVAVNLSPVAFRNRDLASRIVQEVESQGTSADAIELEVTENVVMGNIETAVEILEDLHDAGFRISVDDFGTGYSSLNYLRRFPLSKVKIDRSFITDLTREKNDAAIVSAIIAMTHSLGLRVVAEGVETEEQLRFLQDLHCDEIQGYLISRPVSAADATNLLAQASSIQRMIVDYGVDGMELTSYQKVGSATSMIGILNELPMTSADGSR